MKLPNHKTKIVCTIGPASRSEAVLKKLVTNEMNVARLNFSHGSLEEHRENIRRIRFAADLTPIYVPTLIGELSTFSVVYS